MENGDTFLLREIIYASRDKSISKKINRLLKKGEIRKIAPRLYTTNLQEDAAVIIKRNLFSILGKLYPLALLSHRSAFEFNPTETGQLFLTYTYTKKIKLPGVTLNFLKGATTITGDRPFSGKLYVSQRARAFLENLQVSRKKGANSKTLPIEEIEKRLEAIIRINGEPALNELRDKARKIAAELNMPKEFVKLDQRISALLSTHTAKILRSPVAAARAFGLPYDPNRLELFEILFKSLVQKEFKYRPEQNEAEHSFRHFAFFESYFSNYIEGTIFQVNDAKYIIDTNRPIPTRNADSHDILGTYQLVSQRSEMCIVPKSPAELLDILPRRHQILLAARTDKKPGQFKDRNNFAGQTAFVDLKLVHGTLSKSFDYYQALEHPFSKAAYMMFVISEVHPFLDGNGRIARVMMNAELVATQQTRIIIPTVFRDDYLLALRRLTRQRDPEIYIRMLQKAHEFSATILGNTMEDMENVLYASNAFLESTEGRLKVVAKD